MMSLCVWEGGCVSVRVPSLLFQGVADRGDQDAFDRFLRCGRFHIRTPGSVYRPSAHRSRRRTVLTCFVSVLIRQPLEEADAATIFWCSSQLCRQHRNTFSPEHNSPWRRAYRSTFSLHGCGLLRLYSSRPRPGNRSTWTRSDSRKAHLQRP